MRCEREVCGVMARGEGPRAATRAGMVKGGQGGAKIGGDGSQRRRRQGGGMEKLGKSKSGGGGQGEVAR